jgi:hypothetical protein
LQRKDENYSISKKGGAMHKTKTNNDPRKYVPGYWLKKIENTPENRFKLKCSEPDINGCINWLGYTRPKGYGTMGLNGKPVYVHRFAFELHFEVKVPENTYVAHKCDNRRCVNPEHLFLSSAKVNTKDMFNKKRDRWSKNPILTHDHRKEIYEKILKGHSISNLALSYGVSKSTCYKIYYQFKDE